MCIIILVDSTRIVFYLFKNTILGGIIWICQLAFNATIGVDFVKIFRGEYSSIVKMKYENYFVDVILD